MAVKVGIVGAGGMSRYHYEGFIQGGAEVIAIADTHKAAAEQWALSHSVSGGSNTVGTNTTGSKTIHAYGSLTEMLQGEHDLQAVSIITPNKFHKPLVIEALSASKHVYCEKPPALNAREMGEMAEAQKKSGTLLMFDFNNRARRESQAMMAYIKEGAVGRINSAQASWIRRNGIPGFGGWFTTKEISGGGPVIDLIHMIDLALYFMGYPEPAYLLSSTFDTFMGNRAFKGPWGIPDAANGVTNVETSAHAMLTFKSGQCLFIRNSWAEMNERELVSVVFQGEKAGGKVERIFGVDGLDETSIDSCKLFLEEGGLQVDKTVKIPPDDTMGRVASALNFIEAIEGRAKPLNSPYEALILMRIVDAVYQSAATQKPVAF